MAQRAVAWLRNDLRLHDNPIFHSKEVKSSTELLVVYCIDPRHYAQSAWGSHCRTGSHRGRFVAESLVATARSLDSIGSELKLVHGHPEHVLPELLDEQSILVYQAEDAHEEQEVERAVREAISPGVRVISHRAQTLLHIEDLGWDPREELPLPFGKFYHETCSRVQPRCELPAPSLGALPAPAKVMVSGAVSPTMQVLEPIMGFSQATPDPVQEFQWHGGEEAAWAQLEAYCTPGGLGSYQRTRNQLHGTNSSSHLSPWLAIGCLSVRSVYWRAKRFEREHRPDRDFEHVQKLIFQLCWRDYFHFYVTHFGRRVFFLTGPARRSRPWQRNPELERRWKHGQTGIAIVDALMRELAATGFMSNRGRYIVASYLVFYLNIDWRVGADWFESLLLDHDVCSNYGEWASMANVAVDLGAKYPLGLKGRGPTGGRKPGAQGGGGDPWAQGVVLGDAVFDPFEQAKHYDRTECFVRKWLPELKGVPVGQAHKPGSMGFPAIAVEPHQLSRARIGAATKNLHRNGHASSDARPSRWSREPQGPAGNSSAGAIAGGYVAKELPAAGVRRWKAKVRDGPDDKAVGA
eukprot:TRINITY_DN30541_c0_g1_i1.p1 TRINITY_DN30541_c0_g1~~TRINITY_DN30541_c0_g1_i1.p1  ORF type:complete len:578 (+),score=86.12 TRINITY_DN30541_c0_g1_i1:42-1775(+)